MADRAKSSHLVGLALQVVRWGVVLAVLGPLAFAFPAIAQSQQQDASPLRLPVVLGLAGQDVPADLSFLNHRPAGARGRVKAQGDALVFADGSPAKFWGVNVQANAIFRSSDAQIAYHAARLARMGVNLVRLHHHDSHWVRPNIFGDRPDTTGQIDTGAMRKIDLWVSQLRAHGIYIWLDLHVGRVLGVADEGQDFDELRQGKHKGDLHGYNFVNDDIKALMQAFTTQYLSHVNLFTGLAYKDDPAVVAVLVSNENDLTKHFFNRLLPDRGAPGHAARYMAAATQFAQAHGLDPKTVWKGWEFGAPKRFLADLEHRFYDDMVQHLRALGYEGLIAVGNYWGGMPMAGLAALTRGDLIDMHAYSGVGNIARGPELKEDHPPDITAKISAAHVAGMPLSVSEWNIGKFRAPDRLFAPFQVAAMGAFQGWDALMLYGYAQKPLRAGNPAMGRWHAATDPSLIATLPAAALLYRQGHVGPAQRHSVLTPSAEVLFGQKLDAWTLPSLRQIPHHSGFSVALPQAQDLPWLRPSKARPEAQAHAPFAPSLTPPPEGHPAVGFRHDPDREQFVIDTPLSQVLAGDLARPGTPLSNIEVQLVPNVGVVAVQSLSAAPLEQASDILVSVALPSWPQKGQKFPFMAAPLEGRLLFTAPEHVQLRNVVPQAAQNGITHRVNGTRHTVTFKGVTGGLWLRFSALN